MRFQFLLKVIRCFISMPAVLLLGSDILDATKFPGFQVFCSQVGFVADQNVEKFIVLIMNRSYRPSESCKLHSVMAS